MHYSGCNARSGVSRAAYVVIAVVIVAIIAGAAYVTVSTSARSTSTTTVVQTSVATSIATTTATATTTAVSTETTTATTTATVVTSSTGTVPTLKVALILEGPRLDGSYNQIISTDLGLVVNQSSSTLTASYIDNVGPSDVQRVASTFAQQGFDLIIGDANDLGPGIASVAPQFPKSHFAVYGGNVLGPNLSSFVLWANEGGYLAGYLAGLMTHTGKVGTIVAFKYQSQVAWTNGYMQGVKRAAQELKTNITIINGWTSTWTDPAIGSQSAKSMLASGVDVISEDASGPGSGMQSAVQAAFQGPTTGPYAMGAFVNQNNLGPFMIASVPWNFGPVLQTMVQQVRDGTFGNKINQYFLHDGAMSVVMSSTVPADIQAKVNKLSQSILSGAVVVPLVPTPDLMPSGTITVP